jgi:NAD(P)-dependent dehydrogenase (short-subunit alcohol dehydrogenase family)
MHRLRDRVVIVTGAGRGIGREHALLCAREGASVVVNDLGGAINGAGADVSPAQEVVEEITSSGGRAVANYDDICSWAGAASVVRCAIDTFGKLDVLINNAGILRDRSIVNMTEEEWDAVTTVHLKGHFGPIHFAAEYWREQSKAGTPISASIINTTSGSGLFANPGQANYAAAKAGIAALTLVAARELERFGVRVNAIAPIARTRLTESTPGIAELVRAPIDEAAFDVWDPANISPLVAYLASDECNLSGRVFGVGGGKITYTTGWRVDDQYVKDGPWELDEFTNLLASIPAGPPELVFS